MVRKEGFFVMSSKERQEYKDNLQKVYRQFNDVGIQAVSGVGKEIKYLAKVIDFDDGEKILYAASGLVSGNTVLVVCTSMRVLFIDRGMVYGVRTSEIPLDKVNDVSYSQGVFFGRISVTNGATTTEISWVEKKVTPKLVEAIRKAAAKYRKNDNTLHMSTEDKSAPSYIEQLKQLKELEIQGVITEDEFEAKKKKLLGL